MSAIAKKLEELKIQLPKASVPAANYVPYVVSGNMIYIAGQIPQINGEFQDSVGKLGHEFDIDQGKDIARICGLNLISQVQGAIGDLDKVRCVKLGVFVNSTDDFIQHPEVANGASDLMVEVFGEKGKHARFAVGVSSLPRGVAVEIDGVFEIQW